MTARNLGAQPAPAAGVDGGILLTARISAAQGGQFGIPGGARLMIPAGALAEDTDISVLIPTTPVAGEHNVVFGPSGLRFATPAQLSLPFPPANDLSVVYAVHASSLNPLVDVGSERSRFAPLKLLSRTDTQVLFEVEHFSYLSARESVSAGAYLVLDFPPETLSRGDLMFYLTDNLGMKCWIPGHVAVLVKRDGGHDNYPAVRRTPGLVVEAGGAADGVGFGRHEEIRFAYGHTFLGAFRYPSGLTADEQDTVCRFLYGKLGLRYSEWVAQLPDAAFGEQYNCVGLAEFALRTVGKSLVSYLAHLGAVTPFAMLQNTPPVTHIRVPAGRRLELPVYGVVTAQPPASAGNAGRFVAHYSRRVPYTVRALRQPPDSVFEPATLPVSTDPNDTAPGYRLTWEPRTSQIGQVFELELDFATMRINPAQPAAGLQVREQIRRVVQMLVVHGPRLHWLDHPIDNRCVTVGADGTVVYAWYDSAQGRRRLARLAPPVGLDDVGPETVLDIGLAAELVPQLDNPNTRLLARVQDEPATGTVRATFQTYDAAAGASPNPTVLASITSAFRGTSTSDQVPGDDHDFIATAMSSNGHVAGRFKRFIQWVQIGPGAYTASTVEDVWWIPAGRAPVKVDVNARLRAAIAAAHPMADVTRADALFEVSVLDINRFGVALVGASLYLSQGQSTGMEVVVAAVGLNDNGPLVLLTRLWAVPYGGSGLGAIHTGRLNDKGQAVITRGQGLTTGGLTTEYHPGVTTSGLPIAGATKQRADFWVNSFTDLGDAGGLQVSGGISRAALWLTGDNELVDVHAQLQALDPTLSGVGGSSVARLGDDGTVVGRILTAGGDSRDFVISPAPQR
ncbi:hypothetical protein ABXN37_13825 [Piscinibacter sakaiensis]|uniref:hypothetical protein n=1 Tax=Piscinibacter sakaiensis TaxID=1547922 RepID=UPI0012F92804|nr:hypothetical protein [Piscinibacter sakaiensis]